MATTVQKIINTLTEYGLTGSLWTRGKITRIYVKDAQLGNRECGFISIRRDESVDCSTLVLKHFGGRDKINALVADMNAAIAR